MSALMGAHVLLRADASLQIGTGHVMRCLTLAAALREEGATCQFVSRAHPGHMADTVRAQGFGITLLPSASGDHGQPATAHGAWLGASWSCDAEQTIVAMAGRPADWIIVDHYALDRHWEALLRPHAGRLMVIDDLADRPHDCDLLLDQNLGCTPDDHAGCVPPACGLMVGSSFALLRPQFGRLRETSLIRRRAPMLRRMLIALGGIDVGDATGAVLDTLRHCELPAELNISVAIGSRAPALAAVRERAACMPWPTEVQVDVQDMAQLMADSDLAIGAAGGMAWERCCLGLPTVLVVLAANQTAGARSLQACGAALLLGEPASIAQTLPAALSQCTNTETLASLGAAAAQVTDGGGVGRVLQRMVACGG